MKIKKGSSIIASIMLIFALALSGAFGSVFQQHQTNTAYAYDVPAVEGDWFTEIESHLPKNQDGSINTIMASSYLRNKEYNLDRSGHEISPYLIKDALDLAFLTWETYNNANNTYSYYALDADIDLEGKEWIPIGRHPDNSNARIFYGGIDGAKRVDGEIVGNYKIKNMSIVDSNENYRALIAQSSGYNKFTNIDFDNPYVSGVGVYYSVLVARTEAGMHGFTVENVNINGGYLYSSSQSSVYLGTIAGYIHVGGSEVNISNVLNNSEVTATGSNIGGIVGYIDENGDTTANAQEVNKNIKFINVINNGTITGNQNVGGLIGRAEYVDITNSANHGYIYSSPVNGNNYAGGLIAYAHYGFKINSSNNTGFVEGYHVGGLVGILTTVKTNSEVNNSYNTGLLTGNRVGGLISYYQGQNDLDCTFTINNFYNTGEFNSIGYVGGIVAYANGNITIKNSYNESDIIAEANNERAGGLVGYKHYFGKLIIESSYNSGDIITPLKDNVGGLVGYSHYRSVDDATAGVEIYNSYNIGTLEGLTVGGLVGHTRANIKIEKSFNMGAIIAPTRAGGLLGFVYINNDAEFTNAGIYQSYNTGEISAATYNAGLVGGLQFAVNGSNKSFEISQSYNAAIIQKSTNTYGLIGSYNFYNNNNDDFLQKVDISNSFSLNNVDEEESEELTLLPTYASIDDKREIYVNEVKDNPNANDFVLSLTELRDIETYQSAGYNFNSIWKMPQDGSEGNNGAPYLQDIAGLNITLVINEEIENYSAVILEQIQITREKPGKTFIGWATHQNQESANYVLYEKGSPIPLTNKELTFYAKYETTKYFEIIIDEESVSSLTAYLETGNSEDNDIGFALKEDSNTYILKLDNAQAENFIGWQVFDASNSEWHSLSRSYEKTYSLKNHIDQNFVDLYANYYEEEITVGDYTIVGSFRFKAAKATNNVEIFATSDTSSFGALLINDTPVQFNENLPITAYEGTVVSLNANPDEFYFVKQFEINFKYIDANDNEITEKTTVQAVDNKATFELLLIGKELTSVEIMVEFEKTEYEVAVLAKTTNGIDLQFDNLLTLGENNATTIQLNEDAIIDVTTNEIYTVTENQKRLRFIGYKIMNYLENDFDYFITEENRTTFLLNETITAEFLNKYNNFATNQVVIIAEYIVEYHVLIASGDGGQLETVISSTQGLPFITTEEVNGWYEEDTVINITATPMEYYTFSEFQGSHNGLQTGTSLNNIVLIDKVMITALYTEQTYNIVIEYRNSVTDNFTEELGQVEINSLSVNVGDEITIQNIYSPSGYRFVDFEIRKLGSDSYKVEGVIQITEELLLQYLRNNEIVIAARYIPVFTINVEIPNNQTSMGSYTIKAEGQNLETHERTFDIGARLQIEVTAADYHYFDGFVNVSLSERTAKDNIVIIQLETNRTITLRFAPNIYEVDDSGTEYSGGELNVSTNKFSIGDEIVMMFTPESGQVIKNWTINGINVNSLENATVNSNSVTLTITGEWINKHGSELTNEINTQLNSKILLAIIAIGSVVVGLTGAFVILFISHAKKRTLIKSELKEKEMARYKMDTSSFIKDLREGKSVGQVTDEQVKEEMKRRKKDKKK